MKRLTNVPSGSRTSTARLPDGIVVGGITTSSAQLTRARYSASTSSARNSTIADRLAAGSAEPGANTATVPVDPIVTDELRDLVRALARRLDDATG